jgi:hypothetical protein
LADDYHKSFLFIQDHHKRKRQKSASGNFTIGLVFINGSLAYALLTYAELSGGNFIALTGLFITGGVSLTKRLSDKRE